MDSFALLEFGGGRLSWFDEPLSLAAAFIEYLQTVLWVIVFNAVRIALVVFVEENYSFSIARAGRTTCLATLSSFVIFGTVLSTDRLFSAIVLPKSHDGLEDTSGLPTRWHDWLSVARQTDPRFGVGFGVRGRSSLVVRMLFMVPDYKDGFAQRMPAAQRDYMPTSVAGWEVSDFQVVNRPEHDLQGSDSYIWTLKKDDKKVLISVDGTFNEFHDLHWCYDALGWNCSSNRFYSSIAERAAGVQSPMASSRGSIFPNCPVRPD